MITIFNQHQRLVQLNEPGNLHLKDALKNRQCLTTGDHTTKKLCVRAMYDFLTRGGS